MDPSEQPPPQLFCAPHLRCVEVSGRLVLLDLAAGRYDVTDEVATAMWGQLTRAPADRDIRGLAQAYGVSPDLVATDLREFADAQLAAGRLHTEVASAPTETGPSLRRRRPSALLALRERAAADRDLRADFAAPYAARTGPTADVTAPRVDVGRLTSVFRTADGWYPARDAPLDCLPRSLALTRFLRLAGWPAQHVMGVALYPFEAHAWVEVDGRVINEPATYLHRFTVIQRA